MIDKAFIFYPEQKFCSMLKQDNGVMVWDRKEILIMKDEKVSWEEKLREYNSEVPIWWKFAWSKSI
jgi:hypothetical protein